MLGELRDLSFDAFSAAVDMLNIPAADQQVTALRERVVTHSCIVLCVCW